MTEEDRKNSIYLSVKVRIACEAFGTDVTKLAKAIRKYMIGAKINPTTFMSDLAYKDLSLINQYAILLALNYAIARTVYFSDDATAQVLGVDRERVEEFMKLIETEIGYY